MGLMLVALVRVSELHGLAVLGPVTKPLRKLVTNAKSTSLFSRLIGSTMRVPKRDSVASRIGNQILRSAHLIRFLPTMDPSPRRPGTSYFGRN